jgi:hypothetical protein
VDFTEAVLRLFGLAARWAERMRGLAFLLSLPLIVITVADWRIRRRR